MTFYVLSMHIYPNAENTTYLSHRILQNQANMYLEDLSQLANIHTAEKCYVSYWRRRVMINHI